MKVNKSKILGRLVILFLARFTICIYDTSRVGQELQLILYTTFFYTGFEYQKIEQAI